MTYLLLKVSRNAYKSLHRFIFNPTYYQISLWKMSHSDDHHGMVHEMNTDLDPPEHV